MILIGQYDSSFVRRVGIALKLYELPFEHRPWSVFSDKEKIRPLNPLMRVPALVLDDEDVLVDSHLILAHLESLAPVERSLLPATEPDRHRAPKVAGLATGLADKGVRLFTSSVSTTRSRRSGSSAAAHRSPVRFRSWRRTAPNGRANTGSEIASATPTSRSPAPSATRRKPCRMSSRCRTTPTFIRTANDSRNCPSSGRSASPSSRRPEATSLPFGK